MSLRDLLVHPLARGLDPDSPSATEVRRTIVRQKGFLRQLYADWYQNIAEAIPAGEGTVLEIGSGPGFLHEFIPGLVTSDVLPLRGLSLVFDAHAVPMRNSTLKAIVLIDVLHHLTDCASFFQEAARCVRARGIVVMIEPWVTALSSLVLGKLHYEPFDPRAEDWKLPQGGPLSCANQALPWIIFERDRILFESRFRSWKIRSVVLHSPFSYIVSGGLTMRSLAPRGAFPLVRAVERLAAPWIEMIAMFATIVLERTPE
ncbi:MAG: methyltransferase domain-containing protein [Thermodesulfobacteriota bacterium]